MIENIIANTQQKELFKADRFFEILKLKQFWKLFLNN
jgi:hypothetical protein